MSNIVVYYSTLCKGVSALTLTKNEMIQLKHGSYYHYITSKIFQMIWKIITYTTL